MQTISKENHNQYDTHLLGLLLFSMTDMFDVEMNDWHTHNCYVNGALHKNIKTFSERSLFWGGFLLSEAKETSRKD